MELRPGLSATFVSYDALLQMNATGRPKDLEGRRRAEGAAGGCKR